jgi:hypothetical protein
MYRGVCMYVCMGEGEEDERRAKRNDRQEKGTNRPLFD